MPNAYAHYRFGCLVLEQLPAEEQALIRRWRRLFDIGVHGPDILFYYRPLAASPVRKAGSDAHNRSGQDFFREMQQVVEARAVQEPFRVYLWGVLCHFALDSACHGYVNGTAANGKVTHSELETELDLRLKAMDDYSGGPLSRTLGLYADADSAAVIAHFWPQFTPTQILESLRSQRLVLDAFDAKSKTARRAIRAGLTVSGGKHFRELVTPIREEPELVRLTDPLIPLFYAAVPRAAGFILHFPEVLETSPWFSLPFDPQDTSATPKE